MARSLPRPNQNARAVSFRHVVIRLPYATCRPERLPRRTKGWQGWCSRWLQRGLFVSEADLVQTFEIVRSVSGFSGCPILSFLVSDK